MPNPTVSVVIPAFNAEDTIGAALDSVAAQRCSVHETIVVDDASRDRTAAVVAEWSASMSTSPLRPGDLRAKTVRIIRLASNAGPATARNRGVAAATGQWIAFLDADDAWLPWRLASQFDVARQYPDAALICGGTIPFAQAADGVTADHDVCMQSSATMNRSRPILLDTLSVHNPVATSTVLVRKDALDAVGGFDERFRGPEDYDLWLRLAARYTLVRLDLPLARYRGSTSGLSMDDRRFLPQVLGVIEKAYGPGGVLSDRKGKRRAQAYQLLSCSWMAIERGAWFRAFTLFARSLSAWPGSLGPSVQLSRVRVKLLRRLCMTALGCKTHGA